MKDLLIFDRNYTIIGNVLFAGVMELADVVDSKSTGGDTVPVRVRPPAPSRREQTLFAAAFLIIQLKFILNIIKKLMAF